MIFKHLFNLKLHWNYSKPKVSEKTHQISFPNGNHLEISAAKSFKGDPDVINPEELLLSSLTSCHMMSYLYCCKKNNITILDYKDSSKVKLETYPDGSGKIVHAELNPVVIINNNEYKELAFQLHKEAHQLCFIANSCNFKIDINPSIKIQP